MGEPRPLPKRAGISRVGAGQSWPEGAVIAELGIKSCLLRPDFASVDLWGEAHWDPTPWTLPGAAEGAATGRRGCD